ncbi:MAG: hypothetical protein K2Q03_09360 [Sphingobacteriaceae bacterium]|nr:hypothetical protein [Sphingobacteriaceae bacterium]
MLNKIKFLFSFILLFAVFNAVGQSTFDLQDSLKKVDSLDIQKDEQKILANAEFIKKLVAKLKNENSFDNDLELDTAYKISVLKSSDKKIKIFTWYLQLSDHSYRFYGCIQMATEDGSLKLFPLLDNGNNSKDEQSIVSNKNWLGAKYYDIIPLNNNYILVGWKGSNEITSKKVIDVLWFDKNEALFGKNIFSENNISSKKNRIVFEYNKQNAMTLQYDPLIQTIVFDHLAPVDESKKGNYAFYVSDGSFDGYKITAENKLKFIENIILNNEIEGAINEFENPKLKKPVLDKKN